MRQIDNRGFVSLGSALPKLLNEINEALAA